MLRQAANIYEKAYRSALRKPGKVITESLLRSAADRTLIPADLSQKDVMHQIDQTLANNRRMSQPTKAVAAG